MAHDLDAVCERVAEVLRAEVERHKTQGMTDTGATVTLYDTLTKPWGDYQHNARQRVVARMVGSANVDDPSDLLLIEKVLYGLWAPHERDPQDPAEILQDGEPVLTINDVERARRALDRLRGTR